MFSDNQIKLSDWRGKKQPMRLQQQQQPQRQQLQPKSCERVDRFFVHYVRTD